jgi:hypothetical protein
LSSIFLAFTLAGFTVIPLRSIHLEHDSRLQQHPRLQLLQLLHQADAWILLVEVLLPLLLLPLVVMLWLLVVALLMLIGG